MLPMRPRRHLPLRSVLLAGILASTSLLSSGVSQAGAATVHPAAAVTKTYGLSTAFNPKSAAVNGSTDVYHCSLINPHLSSDRVLVSSEFLPSQAKELHHAIYFLIPPEKAALARSLNVGGKGWSCFGAPLNPSGAFDATTWLGGWAPGPLEPHPTPSGTGIPVPKGSLVVLQIHYNLLAGTAPDRSQVKLTTVPAKGSHLKTLEISKFVAPPDLPCPAGVTGPLCDRQASIDDLVARTGTQAAQFLAGIEYVCKADHNAATPQFSGKLVTTTCTWPVNQTMHILGGTPHMHLLGQSESIVLNHGGTSTAIASIQHYNFDHQVSYPAPKGMIATPGDTITVSCTFDPTIRQRLPSLRKLPARYVTWGDGSSDEMCLGSVGWTAS